MDRLDTDATLGVVGDGPRRDTLERQADTPDARDPIAFTGFLDEYKRVLAHMKPARAFASASTRHTALRPDYVVDRVRG